jgi:FixJ family two-component response regulator
MRGDELAKKLLKIDDSLKLIFVSGYTDMIEKINGNGIGSYCFFRKPIHPEFLINAIKSIANESKLEYPQTYNYQKNK